jgi:hypothetical protein
MADQKVSDLPSINGADVDPADLLYLVDSSAGTAGSKKITLGQFQLVPWSAGAPNGVVYFDGSKVPASSSALTFDGTNLGVGTSSPAEQLTAGSANDRVGLYQSGVITQLRLGSSVAGTAMMVLQYDRSTGTYQLSEGTNGNTGSPDIVIDASGNVGIGTSSPGEKLDVVGAVRSNTASGFAAQLKVRQAGWGEYWLQVPASQNALAFVDNSTGTPAERMRLNSSGNLGIGSVPLGTARLTVYGPQGDVQIRADDGNVTTYVAYSSGTGSSAVNYYGTNSNHDQAFIANNAEAARIKKTGQFRFVPLAAAPTPAEAGDVYYDSGTNKLRCYNGTSWNDLF